MKNKQQALNQTNRVFDTPFFIQEKTVTQDKYGIEREEWRTVYKLFADGRNIYGQEYELARQRGNQKTVKFIIKYGPKIDETMRILFQNKVYDIDNVDNIGFKNEMLEIRAIERRYDK